MAKIPSTWRPNYDFAIRARSEIRERFKPSEMTVDVSTIRRRQDSKAVRGFSIDGTINGKPTVFDGVEVVGTRRMIIAPRGEVNEKRKASREVSYPKANEVLRAAATGLSAPKGQVLQLDLSVLSAARLDLGSWKVTVPGTYYPRLSACPEPLGQTHVEVIMNDRTRKVQFRMAVAHQRS